MITPGCSAARSSRSSGSPLRMTAPPARPRRAVTDPRPARRFRLRLRRSQRRTNLGRFVELGAEVKISYETRMTRPHATAWLFHRNSGYSTAYVGPSNLSRSLRLDGLEWNIRQESGWETRPTGSPALDPTWPARVDCPLSRPPTRTSGCLGRCTSLTSILALPFDTVVSAGHRREVSRVGDQRGSEITPMRCQEASVGLLGKRGG